MSDFVSSFSFSHCFYGETTSDTAGRQECVHTCQDVNAFALTRQFFQFAMGCGYAPKNIVDAFYSLAEEYGTAYCGYDGEKKNDQWDK